MIKTRMETTKIKGSRAEVIADIAVIFKALLEGTNITREEIIEALDDAEKSEAENIDEKIRDLLEEIEQKMKEMEGTVK